jgi:hypothetical protein
MLSKRLAHQERVGPNLSYGIEGGYGVTNQGSAAPAMKMQS